MRASSKFVLVRICGTSSVSPQVFVRHESRGSWP